jgi:hypothetical protein
MITKTKPEFQDCDVVKLDPKEYYKAIYATNGNYTQEDRFDKSIGLKWIGSYKFAIINAASWRDAKKKHKFS